MTNEELIALYFEGKLNSEQQAYFDELLRNDVGFKEELEFEQAVKTAIISTKKDNLRNKLHRLETPKEKKNYVFIGIAASIIIALGVFGLLKTSQSFTSDELYAQYFEPYSNIIAPSSRGDASKNEINIAFRYYDSKNYKIASEKFESLFASSETSYFLFYQAICELLIDNTDKAIKLLEQHKKYNDRLSNQTSWYLALAFLKANQTDTAKELFVKIIDNKSYNYESAQEILEKMD